MDIVAPMPFTLYVWRGEGLGGLVVCVWCVCVGRMCGRACRCVCDHRQAGHVTNHLIQPAVDNDEWYEKGGGGKGGGQGEYPILTLVRLVRRARLVEIHEAPSAPMPFRLWFVCVFV